MRWRVPRASGLICCLAAAGTILSCVPGTVPQSGGVGSAPAAPSQPTGPRGTLRIAYTSEPDTLGSKFSTGSGAPEYVWIFNSFLSYFDFSGVAHPMMVGGFPTRENGDFVVNPDGTMVTTYRLRDNLRWHDGAPLTSLDFVFAFGVYVDPDIPVRDRVPEALMSSVEGPDNRTLVIRWKEPYLRANTLGYQQLDPLPRHLLEEKYRSNRAQFAVGDEWRASYVGNGPFRVDRWEPGSRLLASAYTDWVLGPPKIESIDIRFIGDPNTLFATFLAGEVHLTTSPAIRGTEAAVARDQWIPRGEGYLKTWATRLRYFFYQFREVPNWQPALTDLRVRQALLHAVDRSALVDALTFGLSTPAEMFLAPPDPLFPQIDRAITKYPYDPNRAGALLTEAGWRRSTPGEVRTNAAGQTLDVEVWRQAGPNDEQEISIIADGWKAVGVNPPLFIIPNARARDGEVFSFFPGVQVIARTMSIENFVFTSENIPTREQRWQGSNRGSFRDEQVDSLHRQILRSLDSQERNEATVALHRRMSEVLGIAPLYYEVEVILARNSVKGPIGNYAPQQGITWNIFEWELDSPR